MRAHQHVPMWVTHAGRKEAAMSFTPLHGYAAWLMIQPKKLPGAPIVLNKQGNKMAPTEQY